MCGDLNIDPRNPEMRDEYDWMLCALDATELLAAIAATAAAGAAAAFPATLGDLALGSPAGKAELPFETDLTQSGDYWTK